MAQSWLFGIDGGGTSSRLRIEDRSGKELYYGEEGSTNLFSNSAELVRTRLQQLFQTAYRESGLEPGGCLAGFVGTAGVDHPSNQELFLKLLREASSVPGELGCGNDAEAALAGALMDTEGMLLIAGTGSIALGRDRSGLLVRAGGLGHLLGDEGSAWRVAFDAITRSLRSHEGRDLPTALLRAALDHFSLESPEDFIPFFYNGFEKSVVAGFAPKVAGFRDRGDALAIDIYRNAERELVALIVSVDNRIGQKLEKKKIVFWGGLIQNDSRLAQRTAALVRQAISGIEIVDPQGDPSQGACLLARQLLNR